MVEAQIEGVGGPTLCRSTHSTIVACKQHTVHWPVHV
jgi:hypothetical protein